MADADEARISFDFCDARLVQADEAAELGLGQVFGLAQGAQVEGQLGRGLEEVIHGGNICFLRHICKKGLAGNYLLACLRRHKLARQIAGWTSVIAWTYVEFMLDGRLAYWGESVASLYGCGAV